MTTLIIETATAKFQPKQLRIGDYVLQFGTNLKNGKPTLCYGKIKTVGKNKGSIDYYGRYYYETEQRRNEAAEKKYNEYKERIEKEAKQKELVRKLTNSINIEGLIGRIFYTSWGYDQTNINFYQVIGTTAKMVIVREVEQLMIHSEGISSMSAHVKPILNKFVGNESKHLVKYSGSTLIIVNGRHPMWEYDHRESGLYCSWYA